MTIQFLDIRFLCDVCPDNGRLPGELLRARRVQPDRRCMLFASECRTNKIQFMLRATADTCTKDNEPTTYNYDNTLR